MSTVQLVGPERLKRCPRAYQDRITKVGGVNKYGEPHFKLVWGEAHRTKSGGYHQYDGYTGYRDIYLNDSPCWLLLEWHDPIEYGSPALWYMDNLDEATGLQTQGAFPFKGKYEVLFVLRDEKVENNALVIDAMQLNGMLVDVVIPLMIKGKTISYERRAQALKERRAIEEEEQLRVITDARLDSQLAFGGASFRGRHGANSDMIAKKEEILRRGMVQAYRQMKKAGHGVSIMNR